ncbi:amidohydrolase family protein [Dehalococcoidia bacterium]|nr:amidohydrolase family protein [Dehalococcoidia bacterium]
MTAPADYEIVDGHVHLCRDPEQQKLVFPKKGWPDEWYWCNTDRIIPYMDQHFISHIIVLNIMVTKRMIESRILRLPPETPEKEVAAARLRLNAEMQDRIRTFNDWLCELHSKEPRIIPFVLVDPVLFGEHAIDEYRRCKANGAVGVKLHPSNCGHMPDHPNMMPVYEECQKDGTVILTDTNVRGGPGREDESGVAFGYPINWVPILSNFPKMKLIIAHFCDNMWDDRLDMARQFKDNLYFDMAGGVTDSHFHHDPDSHGGMLSEQVVRVFRKVGTERMLFGSDAPALPLSPMEAASQILALPFTPTEKRQILSENARRLFDLN